MSGGRKICMTDSVGNALFSVPDGGIIRMLYGNGEDYFAVCRYLDETHAEIDGVRYAVRDFAGRMERNRISYAPA
jgi:methyl coenzyme M reductase gamma subunit